MWKRFKKGYNDEIYLKYIKYYVNYDGIDILKCPKCGSYNVKNALDDDIIDVYYRCEDCNYKAGINYNTDIIMDSVGPVSKFIITVDYDIVDKILEKYKIDRKNNKLPLEIVEEMIKIKEKYDIKN